MTDNRSAGPQLHLVRTADPFDAAVRLLLPVASLALTELPGACDATVLVREDGPGNDGRSAEVSTAMDLRVVSNSQLKDMEGPLAEALDTGLAVECPDLGRESRWPTAVRRLRSTGVHSCAVAVVRDGGAVYALMLYGAGPGSLSPGLRLDRRLAAWISQARFRV
jgi:hypothetical protein